MQLHCHENLTLTKNPKILRDKTLTFPTLETEAYRHKFILLEFTFTPYLMTHLHVNLGQSFSFNMEGNQVQCTNYPNKQIIIHFKFAVT